MNGGGGGGGGGGSEWNFEVIFGIPGHGFLYVPIHFKLKIQTKKRDMTIYKSFLCIYYIPKTPDFADFKVTLIRGSKLLNL